MAGEPVRITRIRITKLFRTHDVDIPLNQGDRVTILHGKNGVGKTITLSLVNALVHPDVPGSKELLIGVPRDRVELTLSNGDVLTLTQTAKRLEVTRMSTDGSRRDATLEPVDGGWLISPMLQDIAADLRVAFIPTRRLTEVEGSLALRMSGAANSILFSRHEDIPGREVVSKVARDMAALGQRVDRAYRQISTQLDDTLPTRLFSEAKPTKATRASLKGRLAALEHERERLRRVGLLADAPQPFAPDKLGPSELRMLAVVLDDTERKLAVFKDLADRAEIAVDILSRKFAPKAVKIDLKYGYEILSSDGERLNPDLLSSGEQHELVLLHHLLFNIEPGTLVMIDEPELSLHPSWQTEFLSDMLRVTRMADFDLLMATHSPYIVGSRRDLLVQLGAPE